MKGQGSWGFIPVFHRNNSSVGKMNQNILQVGQSLVPNGLLVSSEKFDDLCSRAGTQAAGGRKTVHSPHSSYTTPPRLSVGRLVMQVEHF